MSQQALADAANYQRPYVTRVEGGGLLASAKFAESCDQVFGLPGTFARLRQRVADRGHAGWFIPYVILEREAVSISNYSNQFVTGILQTEEYAEAVFRAAHPRESDEAIRARVVARLQRHAIMEGDKPPLLWLIVHEAALRTVVGSPAVMVGEIQHLISEAESPHITLQVLPFSAGAPASHLPFILLVSEDGETVLFSETLGQGFVSDSRTEVERAQAVYDRLRAAALSPERSLTLLQAIAEEHAR
jgi:hypothetical protein